MKKILLFLIVIMVLNIILNGYIIKTVKYPKHDRVLTINKSIFTGKTEKYYGIGNEILSKPTDSVSFHKELER